MKRKTYISIVALFVIAVLGFALSPGVSSAVAAESQQVSLTCKQVVTNSGPGAFVVRCRGAVVFYEADTCTGKCAGIPALPVDAKEALDALEVLVPATFVYVRMVDTDQKPIDKWVTVCFSPNFIDNVNGPRVRIYDSHTLSWVPNNYYFVEDTGVMCTNVYGETSVAVLGLSK